MAEDILAITYLTDGRLVGVTKAAEEARTKTPVVLDGCNSGGHFWVLT